MGYLVAFVLFLAASPVYAQQAPPPPPPQMPRQMPQQNGAPISPQQLDNLVAPIALYPDPLVAQILAASTYPTEIAQAEQWLQDHPDLQGQQLMDQAKQQNWDPSVQGLVAFPDVLARLTQSMAWTTDLGNAFQSQEGDVMQSIQRLRAQAQQRGMLQNTPQQTVATQEQNGQPAITIQPTDPNVWYVPNYNPAYVWGPPAWGAYPELMYPPVAVGVGWWPGVNIGLYFGGWGGWASGGWGWYPNWFGGAILVNNPFFHRFGFRNWRGGFAGRTPWMRNPGRFGGPNGFRGNGFGGANRFAGRPGNFNRGGFGPGQRFGGPGFAQRGVAPNRGGFGGATGRVTGMQGGRGFSGMGARTGFGGFRGGPAGGGMRGGGGGMRGGGGGRGGRR